MSDHVDEKRSIRLVQYEIIDFHFQRDNPEKKNGWSFYPEVVVTPEGDSYRGELSLTVSTFSSSPKEFSFTLSLLAKAIFQGAGVSEEEFKQYCLVKGSSQLVSPLRLIMNEFLAKVRETHVL